MNSRMKLVIISDILDYTDIFKSKLYFARECICVSCEIIIIISEIINLAFVIMTNIFHNNKQKIVTLIIRI